MPDSCVLLHAGPRLAPRGEPIGEYLAGADRIVTAGIAAEERALLAAWTERTIEDICALEYLAWSRDPKTIFCVLVHADPEGPDSLERLSYLCNLLGARPNVHVFALAASAPEGWRAEVRRLGANDGLVTQELFAG